MTIVTSIAAWSVLAFALLLIVAQLIAYEAGYRVGRWHKPTAQIQPGSVGVIVGGMLGLLAFVLALTLSFANTRFSERRAGTLAEANAIGTAWLRAKAIGHPQGAEIARLLEEYTQLRKDFVQAASGSDVITSVNQRTNALQSEIWGHFTLIAREQPNPVTASLMSALNEMFDMTTAERFAYDIHLPPQMFWLLISITLLGMAVIGYQLGLGGGPLRLLAVSLIVMWTLVIVTILDLASARLGYLRTGTVAYEWTMQGFQGGATVPSPSSR
jgi:hypothetical protein